MAMLSGKDVCERPRRTHAVSMALCSRSSLGGASDAVLAWGFPGGFAGPSLGWWAVSDLLSLHSGSDLPGGLMALPASPGSLTTGPHMDGSPNKIP